MATNNTDFSSLRQTLNKISTVSSQTWHLIETLISVRPVNSGEVILRAGDVATSIFYLHNGLLREYYLDDEGSEAIRRFCQPGEFSGSLADLLEGKPALVNIEAITQGSIWRLDWQSLNELAERIPELTKLMRRFAEGLYIRKTKREFEMLTLPAAERYARFKQSEPELIACLPKWMVASYLGITPVHLSRLLVHEK